MAHKPYNPAGNNNHRKHKKARLSSGPKCKPGQKFSAPWLCPERSSHAVEGVLVGVRK